MSQYEPLWEHVRKRAEALLVLSFDEIEAILGAPIDHSFLNCKKELEKESVSIKISLKNKTVSFQKKDASAEEKPRFIDLNEENIDTEHLCCLIRSKKPHAGIEAKRTWLKARLREGHVFRKLNVKGCAFIEYAPLESAWVPIVGENYLYIYCLWTLGELKGHGYGKELMEYCLDDARAHGKSGVCMLGADKQKAWLSDMRFAEKYGFRPVDRAGEYLLLAKSFDGPSPHFAENAKKQTIDSNNLTVYYDDQCPYIADRIKTLSDYCAEKNIPARFIHVDSLEQAKSLPCVFGNFAVFYGGKFMTVNQIDPTYLEKRRKSSE